MIIIINWLINKIIKIIIIILITIIIIMTVNFKEVQCSIEFVKWL